MEVGNWTDISHWSDTNGGSGGFTAPSNTDDVFFTSLSNNGSYTVSLDNNGTCLNFDMRNPSIGTVTLKQTIAGSKMLTIYGNIYVSAGVDVSSITGSQTNGLIVRGNTQGRTITTNGVLFPSISVYEGAGYIQQDAFNHGGVTATLLMFNGSWDSNEYAMNLRNFQSSTGPLNLDFTNSVINCTGEWINQAGNITLISTGSNISCRGRWYSGNALGGGKCTYNKVLIDPSASITANPSIDGGNFDDLTMKGYHLGTFSTGLAMSANIVVESYLNLLGAAQDNRMYLCSSVNATQRTITCNGIITVQYIDMSDILGAGTANWDLSSSSSFGDAGGNSNIIFTPSQLIYIKSLSTSTNWHQTNIWFNNSICTISTRIPLPQDDVTTVPTSFVSTANRTLTCGRNRLCRDLDLSNSTYPVILARSTEIYVYGSFKGCPTIGTGSQIMYFAGRNNHTIDMNGMVAPWTDNIYAPNGTYTLTNNYQSIGQPLFGIRQGIFVSNGYTIDIQSLALSLRVGATSLTLMSNMSGSLIRVRGYGSTLAQAPTGGVTTIDMTNSTIETLNTAPGTFSFGTSYIYNDFKISSFSDVSFIFTTAVTLNRIIINNQGACVLKLQNTYPVKYNELIGGGQPKASMTIQNTSLTTQGRLDKQTAGIVILNYVSIKNVNSLDISTIYAVNSVDLGNNLNITFAQPPGTYRKSDFFQIL